MKIGLSIENPLCVEPKEFNKDFIMNLKDTTHLKINGNYILKKEDYNNLVIYTNVIYIDVFDIEPFEIGNEIKFNIQNKIQFNTEEFQKLNIDKAHGYDKEELTLTLPLKDEQDFKKLLKYIKNITTLNINFDNTKVVDNTIEIILEIEKKINKKIKSINCITGNKTIRDIEKLRFLENERTIKIWYEEGITDCSVEDFILMRNKIDEIVNDTKNKNLSNFESIIYVYDIVKRFNYKTSDTMEGRQLHKIFNTESMVCTGFSRIMTEVLNEIGIRTGIYKLLTNNSLHTRCIVHIIDEKYNINGIYSMEPTWESMINDASAYSLFLTPINKLKEAFPLDRFRSDIDVLCGTKKLNEINLRDRVSLYQFFDTKELTQETINNTIKEANKYATLKNFCQALLIVRTIQNINININDVINYNNKLVDYLNIKMGTNINFFE